MKTINTIIVDDELEAREGLKLLLADDPEINILEMCKNGIMAIDMIMEHEIDLVFLDIQMPVVNGFEVVSSIPKERLPHIIFVTAYDQYAIKAFEIHAVDYILKPFTNARFKEGLVRAKKLIQQQKLQDEQNKLKALADQLNKKENTQDQFVLEAGSHQNESNQRLIVKEKGRIRFVPLSEIVWLEAFDYYVKIHLNNQFILIRDSLKNLQTKLPEGQFLRIHNSSIINQKYIEEISTGSNKEYIVILTNQIELKVSRSYKDSVKKIIG